MNVLDLFSGIGGFSLGLERAGFVTTQFVEWDDYCQRVLRKHWPDVPLHGDIGSFRGQPGRWEVIAGGYPCFAYSLAGKRLGKEDDRHLWPQMHRIIEESRPRWVIAENVAGHISLGLDDVLSDLEGSGYTWWAFVIPACAVGSPQRRDRVWIVAHSECERGRCGKPQGTYAVDVDSCGEVIGPAAGGGWWTTEPQVDRLVDGIPGRLAGLKALGNAVVPQVVEVIGRAIMAQERGT